MKIQPLPSRPGRARTGMTLAELMIYMSVVATIALVAFSTLARLWTASGQISAEAQDHAVTLRAAELWRRDVRSATGPVRVAVDGNACHIPMGTNRVVWSLADGVLTRAIQDRPPVFWVGRLARGRFACDSRSHASAVRCDLLLIPRSLKARSAPAFTFAAVPAQPPAQPPTLLYP